MWPMTTSRRAYHHGDLPASVLQVAGKLLEKHGLDRLTMRALARRAQVSHNAPYRHFQDREALLAALAAEGYVMLGEAQREAAETAGLRGMGEAYVRFALAHPQRFRLMFGGQVPFAKHARLRQVAGELFERLAGALAARVPEARGARDASIAAWALVHGLALLLLEQRIASAARGGRDDATFVRAVLASLRFAIGPAQPA